MPTITLPAHYYRQHDADVGADIPGRGFAGWTTRLLEVPLEKTALVSMHAWNPGLDPRIPAGPDSPYVGWFRVVEYLPRAMKITREVFPPLLVAARGAGLTVIHVGSDESYVGRYPEYQRAKALAEAQAPGSRLQAPSDQKPGAWSLEPGAAEDELRRQWQAERHRQSHGEHNLEHIRAGFRHIDFAPEAMPADGEPVVITSAQLNAVCRERGIWHLIYIGFALNWCLLASPGGMIDMSRLGYVCSTIRQATTAVENRESCTEEWAKELALFRVALMFGYVFDVDPVVAALRRVGEG
jgi:nicotinamidase-related amidase